MSRIASLSKCSLTMRFARLVNCGTRGIIVFAQLEQQAFAQVARTHAGGLERLHEFERDSHLVVVGRWLQAR